MNGMWTPMGRGFPPQQLPTNQLASSSMLRHGAQPTNTPGSATRGRPVSMPSPSTGGHASVGRPKAAAATKTAKAGEAAPAQPQFREEPGHFFSAVGETIDKSSDFPSGRYVIVRKLGSGTYGKVLECGDNKYNKCPVAVKIIRKDPPIFREAAKREILVLRELDGRHGCIKMLRNFEHQSHICMSFEILGESLCNLVKRQKQLSLNQVRDVGHQLAHALEYMHAHHFIHTDVKTDNILVAPLQWPMPPGSTDQPFCVKLADMGSTIKSSEWHAPLIGTLECRAPESVLQAGWSFPVDVWAIGCVLLELITGRVVFAGTTTEEGLLVLMEQVTVRRMPDSVMSRGLQNLNQYNQHVIARDPRTGAATLRRKRQHRGLLPVPPLQRMVTDASMLELMRGVLELDPELRLTAARAKTHAFFHASTFDQNFLDEHGRLLPQAIVQEQQRKMREKEEGPPKIEDGGAKSSTADEAKGRGGETKEDGETKGGGHKVEGGAGAGARAGNEEGGRKTEGTEKGGDREDREGEEAVQAPKVDKASGKVDRTPPKVDDPVAKAPPRNTDEPLVKTPPQVAKTPTKVDDPVTVVKTPRNVDEPSVKAPPNVNTTPPKVDDPVTVVNPRKVDEPPAKTPPKVDKTPLEVDEPISVKTPRKVDEPPSSLRTPPKVDKTPPKVDTAAVGDGVRSLPVPAHALPPETVNLPPPRPAGLPGHAQPSPPLQPRPSPPTAPPADNLNADARPVFAVPPMPSASAPRHSPPQTVAIAGTPTRAVTVDTSAPNKLNSPGLSLPVTGLGGYRELSPSDTPGPPPIIQMPVTPRQGDGSGSGSGPGGAGVSSSLSSSQTSEAATARTVPVTMTANPPLPPWETDAGHAKPRLDEDARDPTRDVPGPDASLGGSSSGVGAARGAVENEMVARLEALL